MLLLEATLPGITYEFASPCHVERVDNFRDTSCEFGGPWKSFHHSLPGQITLINSVLMSILVYATSNFLWGGQRVHAVSWEVIMNRSILYTWAYLGLIICDDSKSKEFARDSSIDVASEGSSEGLHTSYNGYYSG